MMLTETAKLDLCKSGRHEFTEANTRIDVDGSRRCRACQQEKEVRRKLKYKTAFQAVRPASGNRAERKAWHAARVAADKRTVFGSCGHEFVVGNVSWSATGHAECRRCKRERDAIKRARQDEIASRETPANAEWKLRGRCASTSRPDTWFASKEKLTDKAEREAAKFACAKCPVKQLCLAAGASEEYGIWGGTTPEDRAPYLRGTITFEQLATLAS